MNVEGVRAFVAVAEEGRFQDAALRLGVSQQAVSKRIAALESALGVRLLARQPTGAVPTEQGRRFLPHARAVLAAVRAAAEAVAPTPGPLRLDILSRDSAGFGLVRSVLRADPGLGVELRYSLDLAGKLAGLRSGALDAALAYVAEPLGPPLTHALVHLEPIEVVVGPRHPLARRDALTPADLAPHRIWIPGIRPGSEWECYYDQLAGTFGLRIDAAPARDPNERVLDVVAESDTVVTLVGTGTRIPWPTGHGLVHRPIAGPALAYPWSLVWNAAAPHPLVDRLLAALPVPGPGPWLPRIAATGAAAAGGAGCAGTGGGPARRR